MKIGVIGFGFVGSATFLLNCKDIEIIVYDINPLLCNPKGTVLKDLKECRFIFITVPTPMNKDGSCHLNIVENVINELNTINFDNFIVLRSTVPIGVSDTLKINFMPEFLTEKNFEYDFINNSDWIFGLLGNERDEIFKKEMTELFSLAFQNDKIKYNNLNFVSNKEAEMIKMFKNCFLATKVSFCNEMYEFCCKKNINYENVRKIACNDSRIGNSHSYVPGHDGKLGFGGTCFPKDVNSMIYQINNLNCNFPILHSVIRRNEQIDRPEKDWELNKGRAII